MFHVLVKWHGSSDVRVERTKWRASPGAVCDSCGSGLERVIKRGRGVPVDTFHAFLSVGTILVAGP